MLGLYRKFPCPDLGNCYCGSPIFYSPNLNVPAVYMELS